MLSSVKNQANLKIAVLTSGGDAPGMNAAIRAVVRTAIYNNIEIYGAYYGYQGLINNEIIRLTSHLVANIISRGGTILKTARSAEFRTKEGRRLAYENLKNRGINALILIGGDGTFRGGRAFSEEYQDIRCVGIPATIDKDIVGTEYTIGFDTALNTVVEAVDKIRDTAESHSRLFIVEVMGRDAGHLALYSGVATGATEIFIPEAPTDLLTFAQKLIDYKQRRKEMHIVLVAEGANIGQDKGARAVFNMLRPLLPGFDIRLTTLGHMQRGGRPSGIDRICASRMGYAAVEALLQGMSNVSIGLVKGEIVHIPFSDKIGMATETYTAQEYINIARVLST